MVFWGGSSRTPWLKSNPFSLRIICATYAAAKATLTIPMMAVTAIPMATIRRWSGKSFVNLQKLYSYNFFLSFLLLLVYDKLPKIFYVCFYIIKSNSFLKIWRKFSINQKKLRSHFHTIRKVKFLSKNSILTKPQHFHKFFTKKIFDNFSRESKLSTAKKSKTTTFSRVFHPKKFETFQTISASEG